MKNPNFFIIGAPKCGTTAIAKFLESHSKVFISNPKETHFFSKDIKIGDIKSLKKYLSIFDDAQEEHIAVGEASTFYLYSKVAVKNILDFNPSAKHIVMLRNPLTMVTSYHAEMCWSGLENIEKFDDAWQARCSNKNDARGVGYACKDPSLLQYDAVCKLGEQVNRLLQIVDKTNVLFVIMDDLKADPAWECRRILDFLGVCIDVEHRLEIFNTSKRPRSALLREIIWFFGRIRKWCKVPRTLEKLTNVIHKLNSTNHNHQVILPELKLQLIEKFRDDVNLLSSLLGRDFSYWLKVE